MIVSKTIEKVVIVSMTLSLKNKPNLYLLKEIIFKFAHLEHV